MVVELSIPTLDTDRLTLEPLDWHHAPGMFELWSAPEVCRYSGTAVDLAGEPIALPAQSVQDSNRILEFFLDHMRRGSALRWGIMLNENKAFIGAVGFNSIASCSELAYHQQPRYWGNGFMLEACNAAISWVMSREIGGTSIEAFIEPENIASVRLVERLGFTRMDGTKDGGDRYVLTPKAS